MAHSFVQAHGIEERAFEAFARASPGNAYLLIDTYDTEAAARKVAALATAGIPIRGVRIDSGDLAAHARAVRAILDAAGLREATIFASGNLDEYAVAALEAAQAPINGYGVGTRMNTSADAPFLDCAYKLQEYAAVARRKRSEGKATWPGRRQLFRRYDAQGLIAGDTVGLADEGLPGEALLVPVMRGGKPLAGWDDLAASRARARDGIARLPAPLRSLQKAPPLVAGISLGLRTLAACVDAQPH
jgi:nicotinate phosphoribosyltransferase